MEPMIKNTKQPNILVRWFRLVEPNKWVWFWETFWLVGYVVLLTVTTIFSAKVINSIYLGDYLNAYLNLGLAALMLVIRNVCAHIQYLFHNKHLKLIRRTVTKKIYNKVLTGKSKEIDNVSKEKIINIALNNIGDLAEFPDAVSVLVSNLIQVMIVLVAVFSANLIAGLIVMALGVVNFFVYLFFNRKLGRIMVERYEKKDHMFKGYANVFDSREVITELGADTNYEGKLINEVDKFSNAVSRYNTIVSTKSNLWFAVWNVVIYAITALMIFYVSQGQLSIETYLIIVPYLTTCTDKLITVFDKSNALENMRVDVDRVNMILNLNDEQLISYGNVNKSNSAYNLALVATSYDNTNEDYYGTLNKCDVSFKMGGVNVVCGERGSGKRIIFNFLRRRIRPDSGKVVLDNLDIYDYNPSTFKLHINYTSAHPRFVGGTVKDNLMIVNKNFADVQKVCASLNIHGAIKNLPDGYNMQINEIKSQYLVFMIGLARALLTNPNIVMIYDIPQEFSASQIEKFKKILTKIAQDRTVILFCHDDSFDSIAQKIIKVKKGNVVEK